ncbi:glycosyltransferase [Desulfitobacterium hafniense]|uniref:Glycosyl transferase group 1 n=1 Tax=Desulfitobacterium hafniense (strain Y51) TaxID=138119 RepID=Q24S83_DESHY|nr:glycosyltransferase [Desulfitobacterium hafniense]BAE85109.1 hypothetical protein DSY3320 [Desulfitobacterium hafniense Y51]
MKICFFCQIWGTGGIESFLLNMLEHMDRSDLKIDIVVEKKISDLYLSRVEAMGLRLKVLSGSTRKLCENLAAFQALMLEQEYDIVYLNIYQALSMLYARAAKLAGVPVRIAHAHGSGLRPSTTRQLKLFLHQVSKNIFSRYITQFWACSGKAADFMFPKGINYRFIPDGIIIDQFIFNSAIREKMRLELGLQNCYVMGNVGRLSSEKNQAFLLDILVFLKEKCPEAVLLLVGEGEERVRLEERAKRLGLSDKVLFYGVSENVPHLLWAMDVLVISSFVEGFGIVAIEAQAAGLPVLCSLGVPPEAGPTDLVEFLSLDAGAEVWADHIRAGQGAVRIETAEILKCAGFDIVSTAKIVRSLFTTGESI